MMKKTLLPLPLTLAIMGLVFLLAGCKPSIPGDIISQGKMEDILYDYHLAMSMANTNGVGDGEKAIIYREAVLRKYDVTAAEFDSSLFYYMRHTELLHKIYNNLGDRLNDEAIALGANANDMRRFGELTSSGDTTNVWNGSTALVFSPLKPVNYYTFEMVADTSYHKGDCIMLDFESHFIYQDGMRDGLAVLAVQFSNDSVASQVMHVQSSQHYSLQVEDRDRIGIKKIKGYFLLSDGSYAFDNSSSTTMKLMFLEKIRMIRMHKKAMPAETSPTVKDSEDSMKNQSATKDGMIDLGPANPPQRDVAPLKKGKLLPLPKKLMKIDKKQLQKADLQPAKLEKNK